jgi:thioredoxin reductase/Pyruvate/2-oxoacid:ferredoxin oxidoreductase delta subunit
MQLVTYSIYIVPSILVFSLYLKHRHINDKHQRIRIDKAISSGMTEPPSLHPVIDNAICVGSGGCARACPETALGVVQGKAVLVDPSKCIGHGACAVACPVDAISLVFGTEKRGMDIPEVKPNFETNVPGVYIAGELGGMGLIRKAVSQGQQAIDSIANNKSNDDDLDVLIVGAGSAGIAASLAAKEKNLRFVTIEQEDGLGGAVYHYPRNKIAMTAPMHLPLVGIIKAFEISKEELLGLWNRIVKQTTLEISFNERLEKMTPKANGFVITTSKNNSYHTKNVLLAIGRRGTPRKLGVPGEEQAKVVYRLVDAAQYEGKHVLVVGGGDSALEAALAIANEANTTVTLSYRSASFSRVKEKNKLMIDEAAQQNKISLRLQSVVKSISAMSVVLDCDGNMLEIPNDAVIVCAGGTLPTPFLKEIGVMVKTHHGTKVL